MPDFISQNPQGQPFGTVPAIPNEFATADLDTAIVVDPVQIQAYKKSIADQMNKQSPGPKFKDLSDRIGNVTLETSAQGASIMTVAVIDPVWVLMMSGFIQVDGEGFLWPPIDVNFPTGTDMVWRLAAVSADWSADMDTQQGNLVLTFEDRIASLLREMSAGTPGGLTQGQPNQSFGGFVKQLIDNANAVLGLNGTEKIRLIEMIAPSDPNYTAQITTLPTQSKLRHNPIKVNAGPTGAQMKQLDHILHSQDSWLASFPGEHTIAEAESHFSTLAKVSAQYSPHTTGDGTKSAAWLAHHDFVKLGR